jgi:hypothetical protein
MCGEEKTTRMDFANAIAENDEEMENRRPGGFLGAERFVNILKDNPENGNN